MIFSHLREAGSFDNSGIFSNYILIQGTVPIYCWVSKTLAYQNLQSNIFFKFILDLKLVSRLFFSVRGGLVWSLLNKYKMEIPYPVKYLTFLFYKLLTVNI